MVKVLVTGGGTGGHVLPVQAVVSEIHKLEPQAKIAYVQQKGDKFADLLKNEPAISERHEIRAGKFRRYHGMPLWKQLLDLQTVFLNIRDAIYNVIGFFQALMFIRKFNPDVVFAKGGFVSVPVGLAAHLLKKPIVTHDSDTVPGLANRIVSRWAKAHAVGAPVEFYDYPKEATYYVGVPIADEFEPLTADKQKIYKKHIHFDPEKPLLLITGGSQGAAKINQAVLKIAPELLEFTNVMHITGQDHIKEATEEIRLSVSEAEPHEYKLLPFVEKDFYKYTGAADVIVTRSGSAVLEFATQKKALILVPNPLLTGGHQTKNAKMYAEAQAALSVDEDEINEKPEVLLNAIKQLIESKSKQKELGEAIYKFAKPDAAKDLAELILKLAKEG